MGEIIPKTSIIDESYRYDAKLEDDIYAAFNNVFRIIGIDGYGVNGAYTGRAGNKITMPVEPKDFEYYGAVKDGKSATNLSPEQIAQIQEILAGVTQISADVSKLGEYIAQGGVILANIGGNITIHHSYSDGFYFDNLPSRDFIVAVKPPEEYMSAYNENIAREQDVFKVNMQEIEREAVGLLMYPIIVVLLSCYLIWVCGKREGSKEIHMLLADRWYVELLFVAASAVTLLGMILGIAFMKIVANADGGELFRCITAIIITATWAVDIFILLSFVRNLKNHSFIKHSLVCNGVLWIGGILKRCAEHIKGISVSKGIVVVLAGYCVLMVIFKETILIPIFLTGGLIALALKNISGLEMLRKGIDQQCSGNISYKINNFEAGVVGDMCRKVDNIGEGQQAALEKELSAERMKTQLITNVSHDLKTPLTAIINYTKLLSDMDLPQEAADYVKIIEGKADKLKGLTSDLFDISKVQSGTEEIKREDIDVGVLIGQSLGELNDEIEKSGLEFNTKIDEQCIIQGDGDKLSRVFENIIVNAVKYSLKGTRVYIIVENKEGSIYIEIKNISAYQLDFDPEEICERFVRGDSSRTTEGNGLGLAIAKSYTLAMGGDFRVVCDGDLFKVMIKF